MTINSNNQQDMRLMHLIENLKEVYYYDLDEGMIWEDIQKFKSYLKERKLTRIEQAGRSVLVDEKALKEKINLNCFECTKRFQYGCCCGSPCAMSDKNLEQFCRQLPSIEAHLKKIDEEQYEKVRSKGGFLSANGKIKAFDGHCSLLVLHEGVYKCLAHKYALEEGIPIYELCPLSCLMYPMEILELITKKKKTIWLITSAVEEDFAEHFSRWGSYKSLKVEMRCLHENEANAVFKKENYASVFEVNRNLLSHEFGKEVVQWVEEIIK